MEKAVLLHPLSEGTRGWLEGRKREFFESLRPAQDQRHCEAARGKEPYNKGTPIGTSRRNPRFRIEI